ncbi:hypothetical protein Micbo1qcDRAFT_214443 [Microdochium bolleyi]|uniref:Uncharacterized protein n=1 Tax=Microdochium bolleyi TaxID=196109 RepID=A0A136IUL3_9PEZI|nr:hypothetical protein Micbo1qcDRAFT_214443 [Microdochium bolleyi]
MCHAHPKKHICGHIGVVWFCCPKAQFDPVTNTKLGPCKKPAYYPTQDSERKCRTKTCLGGNCVWRCCRCPEWLNNVGLASCQHECIKTTVDKGTVMVPCGHGRCRDCVVVEGDVADSASQEAPGVTHEYLGPECPAAVAFQAEAEAYARLGAPSSTPPWLLPNASNDGAGSSSERRRLTGAEVDGTDDGASQDPRDPKGKKTADYSKSKAKRGGNGSGRRDHRGSGGGAAGGHNATPAV